MPAFSVVPYWLAGTNLQGAQGRMIRTDKAASIRVRARDHATWTDVEDTIDYLLKKAERGEDEWPELLKTLKERTE